jgi:hypothetical protein
MVDVPVAARLATKVKTEQREIVNNRRMVQVLMVSHSIGNGTGDDIGECMQPDATLITAYGGLVSRNRSSLQEKIGRN